MRQTKFHERHVRACEKHTRVRASAAVRLEGHDFIGRAALSRLSNAPLERPFYKSPNWR